MVISAAFHALTIRSRHNRKCLVDGVDGWFSSSRGAMQPPVTSVFTVGWGGLSHPLSFIFSDLHPSHSGYPFLLHFSFCFTSLPPSSLQQTSGFPSLPLGSLSPFRRPPSSFLSSFPSIHLPFSLSRSAVNHDPYPHFSPLCMCM